MYDFEVVAKLLKVRRFAVVVLSDNHGLSPEAFEALLECFGPDDAAVVKHFAVFRDGRYYVDFGCIEW